MPDRFAVREDADGWTVYDIWTGQPVTLAMSRQTGLDFGDAQLISKFLSDGARFGVREVFTEGS